MAKNNLPGNKEPASACQYNAGVACPVSIQNRRCGMCGWKPSVSSRRLEKIKQERQEELSHA